MCDDYGTAGLKSCSRGGKVVLSSRQLTTVIVFLLVLLAPCLCVQEDGTSHHDALAYSKGKSDQAKVKEMPAVSASDLPPEARRALDLIRQGGPYPYPRDGIVFG